MFLDLPAGLMGRTLIVESEFTAGDSSGVHKISVSVRSSDGFVGRLPFDGTWYVAEEHGFLDSHKRFVPEAFAYDFSGRASAAQGANKEAFKHFKRAVAADASLVPEDGYERLAVAGFLFGESSRAELKVARRHYRQSPTLEAPSPK